MIKSNDSIAATDSCSIINIYALAHAKTHFEAKIEETMYMKYIHHN